MFKLRRGRSIYEHLRSTAWDISCVRVWNISVQDCTVVFFFVYMCSVFERVGPLCEHTCAVLERMCSRECVQK